LSSNQRNPSQTAAPGGPAGGEIFLESTRTVRLDWRDGALAVQAGSREGVGIRRIAPSGETSFRSVDEIPERERTGAPGTGPAEDPWDREEAVTAAVSWIGRAAGAAAGALCGARRSGFVLHASAQLYRQAIAVGATVLEAREEPARDVRSGARIELKVLRDGGRVLRRRIAAADIHRLVSLHPPESVGTEIAESAALALEAGVPAGGSVAALFAPAGCGALLHEIGHFLEASCDAGQREARRRLLGGAGARVAPPTVTLVDDPAARATLVREGAFVGEIGSGPLLRPAGRASEGALEPDRIENRGGGHARRGSYRDLPLPRMACTFLAPGPDDPEEILRSTRRGLYVRALGGGRADLHSGAIDLIVEEGFQIEEGRLARPLGPVLLSGTIAGILGGIDRVGHDLGFDGGTGDCAREGQSVPVIVGMPTLRIASIGVVPR
jgi:predicted Zn-dependent protease